MLIEREKKMKVILLEKVEKLGLMGETVDVKSGYARNFLLPQGKALRATENNIAYFESKKAEYEANNIKAKGEAQKIADKIEGAMVTLIRSASETGHLYGSVRNRDVAEAMEDEGFKVDRTQIRLDQPLKELGVHDVKLSLHPEVLATIKVNIALSEEEAEVQSMTGEEGQVVEAEDVVVEEEKEASND